MNGAAIRQAKEKIPSEKVKILWNLTGFSLSNTLLVGIFIFQINN
jgi:hypothetical protein